VVLGGGVPLVGLQKEIRSPSGYTPRDFTSSPDLEAKEGFSGFVTTNKQPKKQTTPGQVIKLGIRRPRKKKRKFRCLRVAYP